MEKIAISQFKARCLALLDGVHTSGNPLLITKRGKPVARVTSAQDGPRGGDSPIACMAGTAQELSDITAPLDSHWLAADYGRDDGDAAS